ncbi:hypothetical protein QP027_11100 [Corynebacterium breve]|uniref:ATP-binding protein n=1 Tax=Corynebacterium breve TaxID=3049799 RepID=A0ABY8VFS2_9CORY|nr:hypothetical protein [Corynebacterium breve]WIM67615.1 hypothetical protein QP027_11100 [Corynebacterium breve]
MSHVVRDPYSFQILEPGATHSADGRKLPENWAEGVAHCVAMAGARSSGKSLYIAVLVKQLELLANEHDRSVLPVDQSTADRYHDNYEVPLFEEMKHMDTTPSGANLDAYQSDPFIFSLGEWLDPEGVLRTNYLVIRDVAGEDLENLQTDTSYLNFFQHADLVVFLFDPLRVPSVSNFLHGFITDEAATGGDPETVFANLMTLLGPARPKLAIAVSKFDTLQKLEELDQGDWKLIMGNVGAAFRRDTGIGFDWTDAFVLNQEVRSLLQYIKADNLYHQIISQYREAEPDSYHFFAVSALGESTQGERVSRLGIAPYRVLDPIRWLLSPRYVFPSQ